ncbi:hypothetical protein C4587_03015 [Candidatus Parcubacteria bacterium]|nr:MAG: hypothetical protein C4587_03015 [Candidatus Parcubacteria bacterium]
MPASDRFSGYLGTGLVAAILAAGLFMVLQTVFGASVSTSVTVGNAAPSVTAITISPNPTITLTANATTAVQVNATITDNNGCADITGGTTTVLLYRSGYSSSTCLSAGQDSLRCYVATAFTASSTCSTTSQNTTTTFGVQYFAQATDASSSFSSQTWRATVIFKDANNATGTADDGTSPNVATLTAIQPTSSINYGTLAAGQDTGSTNQVATTSNAGNSSTTLQLRATQTLTSGSNTIATSSQVYSTSTFTYAGTSTALTDSLVTVGGFFLTAPTSQTLVSQGTFWGLSVPGGTATGTYSGTNEFSALFQP